jgi:hypothetical protein
MHCMAYVFYNAEKAISINIRPDKSKNIFEEKDSDLESIDEEIKTLSIQLENVINK